MAQSIAGAPSQSGETGSASTENGSDSAIASMEQTFDRAIAKAAEVTEARMEGGSALDAARTRLSN